MDTNSLVFDFTQFGSEVEEVWKNLDTDLGLKIHALNQVCEMLDWAEENKSLAPMMAFVGQHFVSTVVETVSPDKTRIKLLFDPKVGWVKTTCQLWPNYNLFRIRTWMEEF